MPSLLYADELVLCGESDENLRAMMGRFVRCVREVNTGKRWWCEVCVDGIRLEHVSEFKCLRRVLDESGTAEAECSRKVASGGG